MVGLGGMGSERNREGDNCTLLSIKSSIETDKKQSSREKERVYRFSMHNLYCSTPGVFLDSERQYWGVSFLTESVNTGEVKRTG